jgi:site-specific DNA-methyltransferase (adenine-specific)
MKSPSFFLHQGDCIDVMVAMPDASVDAIVTDPPYELGFMGKQWDSTGIANSVDMWAECLRILRPGGHLLAFGGTRTSHRMVSAIEDAGFEIRDQIMWVYGSGFPKSLNVGKAIDKSAGAGRETIGRDAKRAAKQTSKRGTEAYGDFAGSSGDITAPATDAAKQWDGWGTALKPAHEPICVARKPLGSWVWIGGDTDPTHVHAVIPGPVTSKHRLCACLAKQVWQSNTVAENVLAHGTGAINIDGCRVNPGAHVPGGGGLKGGASSRHEGWQRPAHPTNEATQPHTSGRWPANIIHDGSDDVLDCFPQTSVGTFAGKRNYPKTKNSFGEFEIRDEEGYPGSYGSAARYFYCAKASRKDRNEGLDEMEKVTRNRDDYRREINTSSGKLRGDVPRANAHPTVKPTELMTYLCRLVTPPGGTVLDPFAGSGSTGKAAIREGFDFIGIEQSTEYFEIAQRRIEHEQNVAADLLNASPQA